MYVILTLSLLLHATTGVWSLKIVKFEVPTAVEVGSDAILNCVYDLEGDTLYSVKFYHEDVEFYRYLPRTYSDASPYATFPSPGIEVDINSSTAGVVKLLQVNSNTTGQYRCEVSTEAPTFATEFATSDFEVALIDTAFVTVPTPRAPSNYKKAQSCQGYLEAECQFEGTVQGTVNLRQCAHPPSEFVAVDGSLSGLSPDYHGFHIHQHGGADILQDCTKAGPHFNVMNVSHGSPVDTPEHRHTGDLGNIFANRRGVAQFQISDRVISLFEDDDSSVIGRGLVIHGGTDDLGTGDDEGSSKTGNAGQRLGCCVINKKEDECKGYLKAECLLEGSKSIFGLVKFRQCALPASKFVAVDGSLSGLNGSYHGLHVHQHGGPQILQDCTKAGPHLNVRNVSHGSPVNTARHRHTGDLGNIISNEHGVAEFEISDRVISLVEGADTNVIGRGLVIHGGADDLGTGGDEGSHKTGNAGQRLGCCVINRVN